MSGECRESPLSPFYYYECYDEVQSHRQYNRELRERVEVAYAVLMGLNVVALVVMLFVAHEARVYVAALLFSSLVITLLYLNLFYVPNAVKLIVVHLLSLFNDRYYKRVRSDHFTAALVLLTLANLVIRIVYGIDIVFNIIENTYNSVDIDYHRTSNFYGEVIDGDEKMNAVFVKSNRAYVMSDGGEFVLRFATLSSPFV